MGEVIEKLTSVNCAVRIDKLTETIETTMVKISPVMASIGKMIFTRSEKKIVFKLSCIPGRIGIGEPENFGF